MHWHASFLRFLTLSTILVDEYRHVQAAPATYIVSSSQARSKSTPHEDKLTSASDAILDCLERRPSAHGALLVFADDDEDADGNDYDEPTPRTFVIHKEDHDDTLGSDDDVQPVALVPRTVEPFGLMSSVGRTFKNMPFSQRMAVFSTFAGAVSVPAYLYNAAQGFDEEEIARLKADALLAQTQNNEITEKKNGTKSEDEHESHGHVHNEDHTTVRKAKKILTSHKAVASSKMPGRAMPVYAVRPRDITVPSGKDVNIVINFEPVSTNRSHIKASQDGSDDNTLSPRSLASSEEAVVIENALKKRPHGPKRKVIIAKTTMQTTPAKPAKVPNETVGKLLDYTGMSTAVLYTLAALNSMWRAAIIPDSDLKKYRRASYDDGGNDITIADTALVCVPFEHRSESLSRPIESIEMYDMSPDGNVLVRRSVTSQPSNTLNKRGVPSATVLAKAGKHAKTLGIGGIGLTWGFMMHNMGQRRSFDDGNSGHKDALIRRSVAVEEQSLDEQLLDKRWTPGRGSILFASVLAGTGLAKAGLGTPALHPTVVEEESQKRSEQGSQGDLLNEKRGISASPTLWSTLHRGLNDKVTIALGSMAASALAVKSGLAGDVVGVIKKPFTKHNKTEGATHAANQRHDGGEATREEDGALEKRQLGKGVTALVGGFTGLYLAQHLGSSGQERENKQYKQQLGLQRRDESQLARRGFELGSTSDAPVRALENVFADAHVNPTSVLFPSSSLFQKLRDGTFVRSRTAPGFTLHRSVSRAPSIERYLDGSPRGRTGYEQAKAKKARGASQAPKTRWVPVQRSEMLRKNPDLIAEIRVRQHNYELDKTEPRKMHSKAKILAAGFGGTAAGAFLHHAYTQASRQVVNEQGKASPSSSKASPGPLQAKNASAAAMPDDVPIKTKKGGVKAARGGAGTVKKSSKVSLRPVSSVDEAHAPLLERKANTRNDTTQLQKRGAFNTALFGALVGTTGAATLYSWKHDEPGTRKVRHVPAGFLENATANELEQSVGNKRDLDGISEKRSLYSSLAKIGAKVSKTLPAWMKTSKAKGAGAIAGGLALSTTAALMDDGPKEQKKKPEVFKENSTTEAKNVFSNTSDAKTSAAHTFSSPHVAAEEYAAELQRRANLLAPLKALKQLHADVVLRHGKTAGNALIVGGVAASAGATGLLKRQEDDGPDGSRNDQGLEKRGAFGSNVFKMIDVASLAVPAGAIIGGLASKTVHAVSGKGSKGKAHTTENETVKRSITTIPVYDAIPSDEPIDKRAIFGMSPLSLASMATMGGGLLASPIKSAVKGLKGGGKHAAKSAEAAAHVAKRDLDVKFERRGAPAEIAMQAVKKPQTKVLGMSLLSAASMSTMFGFLIAPPIKSAWKKHKKTKEEASHQSSNPGNGQLARRATMKVKVPDYSEFLDEMLVETHKKKLMGKRDVGEEVNVASRSLQQTIDYKFSKDGGEFKVSFSPFQGEGNQSDSTSVNATKMSKERPPSSLNNTESIDEGDDIVMPINDTLAPPKTVQIHAHEDAKMDGKKLNATAEQDKELDIHVQKRCVGTEKKAKGQHPSIEAHRQLKQDLALAAAKRNMTPADETTTNTSTGAEKDPQQQDKIEYDVNKDGAHFEATFVARQPQETEATKTDPVDNSADKEVRGPGKSGKHTSKAVDTTRASDTTAPGSLQEADTAATLDKNSQSNPPALTVPTPSKPSKASMGAPHLESVENTVKTDPSGVTTVTTRIAPVRRRSTMRADR